MDEKFITLEDANGEQTLAEILFTLPHEGNNFVFLTITQEFDEESEEADEQHVLVYKYIESEDGEIGDLIEIDENDDETWEFLDEVFATFEDTQFEM